MFALLHLFEGLNNVRPGEKSIICLVHDTQPEGGEISDYVFGIIKNEWEFVFTFDFSKRLFVGWASLKSQHSTLWHFDQISRLDSSNNRKVRFLTNSFYDEFKRVDSIQLFLVICEFVYHKSCVNFEVEISYIIYFLMCSVRNPLFEIPAFLSLKSSLPNVKNCFSEHFVYSDKNITKFNRKLNRSCFYWIDMKIIQNHPTPTISAVP